MRTWTREEEKAELPDGPWMNEPDKAVWVDPKTDLDCMIVRNRMGALCGYVGVGPRHPFHGFHYDCVHVQVHGGLTHADACHPSDDESQGICHAPEPGREHDIWWFGFDCAHGFDLIPHMLKLELQDPIYQAIAESRMRLVEQGLPPDIYRDFEYVKEQCELLAYQLTSEGTEVHHDHYWERWDDNPLIPSPLKDRKPTCKGSSCADNS